MFLSLMLLSATLTPSARAEIPTELYKRDQCTIQRLAPAAPGPSAGVEVLAGVRCHTLYAHIQLLEVAVEPSLGEKEFYFYDRNETYEFERAQRGYFPKRASDLASSDGGVWFRGTDERGRERYLMAFGSVFRPSLPAPVEIYVKAAGRQLEGRAIFLD